MWVYSRTLIISILGRPAFLYLGVFAITSMALFSSLFYFVESELNPGIHTALDAAYFTVATMTSVGFGDIAPVTDVGKVVAIIMMLLGTFLFVSFTGVVASTVLEVELKIKTEE